MNLFHKDHSQIHPEEDISDALLILISQYCD